jgi:hypothetical protein
MRIGHWPLVLVFLKVPEYIRDLLGMPLMGSRILYVDLYLIVLGCLLCWIEGASPLHDERMHHQAPDTHRLLLVLGFACAAIFVIDTWREEEHYLLLQLMGFMLSIQCLRLALTSRSIEQVLRSLHHALLVCFLLQASFAAGALAGVSVNPDWLARNHLPYAAVCVYALLRHYGIKRLSKWSLLVCLGLTAINSTKGALLLLIALHLLDPIDKALVRRPGIRRLLRLGTLGFAVLSPFIVFHSALLYLGATLDDFKGLESYRYYINDNITSLISRTISVVLTLAHVINSGQWMGLGQVKAAELTFYGYPVHNYFISAIAMLGVLGALLGLFLLHLFYRVSRENIGMALIGVFVLTVSNDLYASLSLLFIPLIWPHANPSAEALAPIRARSSMQSPTPGW